jgi:hypothetical protein
MQHVGENPADYVEPRPLGRAFASVPNMPPGYDCGALTDELERLKLFVVEHSVRDTRLAHFKLLQDVRYLLGQRNWSAMCNGRPQV